MKILLIGATGKLGAALRKELSDRGHDVVTVGRAGGDLRYDITDPTQIAELYGRAGRVDAVVSAAGDVPYRPVTEMTPEDYQAAFCGTVFTESLADYGDYFPGMGSIDLAEVAQAYVRSVEGAQTGQVYAL